MDMTTLDKSIENAVGASVGAIWKQRLIFLLITSAAFATSTVAILSLKPVYEGTTLLLAGQSSLETTREPVRPQGNNAVALTQIAQSNEVIQAAITAIGAGYAPPPPSGKHSLINEARERLFGPISAVERPLSPMAGAIADVRERLRVRSEANSNVLQISFRDPDPVLAARFANAIGQAFADRQVALSSRPGAVEFFRQQKDRFEDEHRQAAAALERFAAENRIYSIDEQRALLLRRLSDLEAKMATGRGELSEKQGQRQMLGETLRKLAPVARSSYVSSLVDAFSGDRPNVPSRIGDLRDDRTSDPPLLLVQVYQSSMTTLFRLGAEIQGTQNLLTQLDQEHVRVATELDRLSRRADEIERLKQAVKQAAYNTDLYATRSVDEQIAAELQASRLASVKVIQEATEATRPAFPNYRLLLPAAAVFSLMLGLGCALLVSRRR
ncbi:hypothetical protein QMO56_25515 [Roseomonas sp. E05]|uniref:GumC family protein n=1 Tax=Roseomonas sp. E05 TaxID=3046310 RepID=UPI0024B8A565|nr:hypothetical protein [Roseomonas sp. E05]MDJ0391467.1 hypothetical protein [Roseomonas sp. E05]